MTSNEQPDFPHFLSKQTNRLAQNLKRVDSLLDLNEFLERVLADIGSDDGLDAGEVLRAAVVLLHASLEDFLRSIASDHLPRTDNEFIKGIPLAGQPRSGKYTISDLLQHRGKSIDTVLHESIDQWLNRHSFNHTDDVRDILKQLGMPVDYFEATYEDLDKMISRRHQIVHHADRIHNSPDDVAEITRDEVHQWMDNLDQFMSKALYQLQFVVERADDGK